MQAGRSVRPSGAPWRGRPRGITVVDLSEILPHEPDLTALQESILNALQRATAGVLPHDELLARVEDRSLSEVARALQDLTVKGLIRVVWKTPFRFLAILRQREKVGNVPAAPRRYAVTA